MPNPYIIIEGKEYTILRHMGAGQILLRPIGHHEKRVRRIEWAQRILEHVNHDKVIFARNGVFTYALDSRIGCFGTAVRMPSDEDIEIVGKAVAYSNLMGRAIPDYI